MLDDDNDPSTSDMPELIVDSDSDSEEYESDMTDGDESEEEDIDDICRNLEWNFDKAHLCSSINFDKDPKIVNFKETIDRPGIAIYNQNMGGVDSGNRYRTIKKKK